MFPRSFPTKESYENIGGWLLLFNITLFLLPITAAHRILISYQEMPPYFSEYPGIYEWLLVGTILTIVLAILAILTGILLFKIRKNAIIYSKIYLVGYLATSIIMIFVPNLVGMDPEIAKDFTYDGIINAIRKSFYFVIWYWYLCSSVRVKLTFSK